MSNADTALEISLVALEYTISKPLDDLDLNHCSLFNRPIRSVPIIDIFGSTIEGKKVCMHVHQCMPYLMVNMPNDILKEHEIQFVQNLCGAIEATMERQRMNQNAKFNWKQQYIHEARIVKGTPFYGYCPNEQLYIKIYIYNPHHVSKVAAIMLNGAIQV
jgi:DNA polymerase zeta